LEEEQKIIGNALTPSNELQAVIPSKTAPDYALSEIKEI
jgi:hypothetical protein